MSKVILKDYIGWGIGILGIAIAIILGIKNNKLENNQQVVYNHVQTILQFYNYNALPELVKEHVSSIAEASAPVGRNKVFFRIER